MASEHETAPAPPPAEETTEKVAETTLVAEPAAEGEKVEKPKREPLTPEERAQKKAERLEKRKEQRKAAREAAKEAKARGEAPPPKPKKEKAAPAAAAAAVEAVVAPEGGAPKITVGKLPGGVTAAQLRETFAQYGIILRAEASRGVGIIVYNQHNEVRRAVDALHGKHTYPGSQKPITIKYAKDSVSLGELVKKTTDGVADLIRQNGYKPGVLSRKEAKELINRAVLGRRKPPATEVLTAALLVRTKAAKLEELVSKLVESGSDVERLLKDVETAQAAQPAPAKGGKATAAKEEPKAATPKPENTFDAVVPFLDKLEKERWNLMAKANLRFKERHRFRFVDILATPSLELWRWMLEDCDLTAAEAGTCFAILQKYYGYTK